MRRIIPNYRNAALFFVIASICGSTAPVMAGQAPPQSIRPPSPLDAIEYDAARSGPLLLVAGGTVYGRTPLYAKPVTIDQWADRNARIVVKVGGITVLAPRTMQVIEERPGTPDPYAKLKPEERLKVLLSLFTEDQWKLARQRHRDRRRKPEGQPTTTLYWPAAAGDSGTA